MIGLARMCYLTPLVRQVKASGIQPAAVTFRISQIRFIHPITGPPKYPLTTRENWVLGVGFIIAIMIIPTWGLFSVPAWVEEHNRTD